MGSDQDSISKGDSQRGMFKQLPIQSDGVLASISHKLMKARPNSLTDKGNAEEDGILGSGEWRMEMISETSLIHDGSSYSVCAVLFL